MRSTLLRDGVRQALGIAAAAAAVGYSAAGNAQQPIAQLEEVIVTGTRIARQDYQAASPVVSLSAEQFDQMGTLNAEQLVNTLPQVVPHFSTGNNNPGNGQSYIDLRGLGPERNIVLVDGRRLMISSSDGRADINVIPTGLIERVEILSGGASAVYGSDAISGATNFILRRDFEGLEISAHTGQSGEGDAQTDAIELLLGAPLADDQGHVMLWAIYNERDLLSKGDRDFSRQAVSTTSYFPSGHIRQAAGNPWSLAAVQDVFTNLYGAPAPTATSSFVGNDDGTLFTQGNSGEGVLNFRTVQGEDLNGLFVGQNFIEGGDGFYSYNFEPFNNLVLPQERLSLGTDLALDLSENVEVYTQILFTNYTSDTRLAPSPAPTGENITNPDAGVEFTVPWNNPFVLANPGLSQILASRTGDNPALPGAGPTEDFIYRRRFIENGPRIESYERDAFQFVGGIRGNITENWQFDFYFARGKYNEQQEQNGNVSVTRVESLLDAPDGGVGICEGGFNPIPALSLSPDCADYIGVLAKNTQQIEHNHAEFVASGDVFEMPGGTASLALGLFWQKLDYEFKADEILASGDVAGFNAQDNIIGTTDNTDVFAELFLPVTERLGVTTGYRASDHNIADRNNSYKLELDWEAVEGLRVRGSYQRAVRAPNIEELFEPLVEDNPMVTDPCNFDSAFRTGPNAAQVEALCLAQGILPTELATYTQTTDQIDALQGGNPDLQEEKADTYTIGVVWEPRFNDNLQLSVDYYNIEIEDVITFLDPSLVMNRCFNANGENPTYDPNYEQCTKFTRTRATGEINSLLELTENIGGLRTDGVDVQVDWRTQIGEAHNLSFNFLTTFVNEFAESPAPGEPFVDYVGTIGDNEGEALPDLKASWTAVWDFRNFSNALRLRYLPSMDHEESVLVGSTDPDICDCTGVDSVVYVDASTTWRPTDAMSLRLGIQNLTDEDPQLYTPDQDSGTNPTVYDVIGRRWYLTFTYRF
ncbi:MAG TPA: TonB-dependent receptor [Gammaproteobacteria bacterium]